MFNLLTFKSNSLPIFNIILRNKARVAAAILKHRGD